MTGCVVGHESLDELERLVQSLFGGVKATPTAIPQHVTSGRVGKRRFVAQQNPITWPFVRRCIGADDDRCRRLAGAADGRVVSRRVN